jgi:uncharacterized protein (DUF2141 family)
MAQPIVRLRDRMLLLVLLTGCLLCLPVAVSLAQTVSFGAATNFAVGSNPDSVALGDVNGDGKLDLAVGNSGSNNVSILLGNGTGSFGAATNFAVGTDPRSVALGDVNGDGKLDLVVANNGSGNVSILLGTGTGSFGAATNFAAGNGAVFVALGDVNGDGKLDLVVGNQSSSNISILLGNGTGSFGAATNFAAGDGANRVALGDVNGDGKLDLAVANRFSNDVSILLGDGTGSFGAATNFAVGTFPISVALGDVNGDGKLDLVSVNTTSDNVSILLGDGTGSFETATNFAVGDTPAIVALGDVNGDGKLDLAVTTQTSDSVSILLGNGIGSFGAATNFVAGHFPFGVMLGDVNGDGKLDLAVANFGSDNVSILLNTTLNTTPADTDGDGVLDGADNCPLTYNPDQADQDGDDIGDACDADIDGDGVSNEIDNCPSIPNANQSENPCDEANAETTSGGPTTNPRPGESSIWIDWELSNTSGHDIKIIRPDCLDGVAFSVKRKLAPEEVGDELAQTHNVGPSIGPDKIITVPINGSIRGRCDLLGQTGTAIEPVDAGTYQVTTTVSSLLPTLGGQSLNLVTDTAPPIEVTVAGAPVTEKKGATVAFTPLVVWKEWTLPLGAAIYGIPGRPVTDIDPNTIRFNGAVPIIPRSAVVLKCSSPSPPRVCRLLGVTKDVLTVAFNGQQAIQTLGTLFPGTTVFPTVAGSFKAPVPASEIFTGQGKLNIIKKP